MPIKNALSITLSRFSLTYKIILALFIIILIFSAIGFSIIYPVSHEIVVEINDLHLITTTREYLKELLRGGLVSGEDLTSSIKFQELEAKFLHIGTILKTNSSNAIASGIIATFLVFLFSILSNSIRLPSAAILNTFMSSNGKYGFSACFIANIKNGLAFGSLNFLISISYYAIGLTLGFFIAWGLFAWNKLFGLMFGVTFLLVIFALKKALFQLWLPAIVCDNMKSTHALKYSWKHAKETFLEAFGAYVAISFLGLAFLFLIGITTFGIGVIFLAVVFKVFMQSYDLVLYYRIKRYNFYVDDQKVVNPNKHYKDAIIDNPLNLDEIK